MNVKSDFWRNKKVLVTGHTGFKGSWLCLWLLKMGAKVSGVSLAPEAVSLFEISNLKSQMNSHIVDICHLQSVMDIFEKEKPEIVLHLAAQALVRPSYINPVSTYMTNVMGTLHLLEAVRAQESVRSCIIVTSDKCYENREWIWGYREDEAMGGWDPYSSSKGCAEILTSSWVRSFFSNREVGIASARAGNVFGGGDFAVDRLIPDCVKAYSKNEKLQIRSPKSIRPWQHVLEPLSGYLVLAEQAYLKPYQFRGGWNFGPLAEQEKTVEEIVQKITQMWGGSASYSVEGSQLHEAAILKLDCSKAKHHLNWVPSLDLETSLKWTVDWYRAFFAGENVMNLTHFQIDQFQKAREI